MKTKMVEKILLVMNKHGKQGVTILWLAKETEIKIDELRRFIKNNPEFFIKVGSEAKYTINCFGQYKGNVDEMLAYMDSQNKQKKKSDFFYYIIGVSVFVTLVTHYIIRQANP